MTITMATKRGTNGLRKWLVFDLANNPEALINFEAYLAHHFDKWIAKRAHDPEGMAAEFEYFAGLYD